MNVKHFRKIQHFPSYEVSNYGEVKSIRRKVNSSKFHRIIPERILIPQMNKQGVVYVNILREDGKKCSVKVEKLVLETFAGVSSAERIDSDPFNNRLDNFKL